MSVMARHGRRAALAFLLTAEIVVSAIPSGASSAGDPFEQVKRLGRGVNILGYDPIWDNFGDGRFKDKHFKLIRAANPERTVVIGPPSWNGIGHLDELKLPEADRNIIVTVHYYEPMRFTHQGAPWSPENVGFSNVRWGSEIEKKRVEADLGRAQIWATLNQRPIILGEFGAYDRGPTESRARYTAFIARTAESLGWAWAYWQFDSDFIAFDIDRDRWVTPILKALIPGE